MLQLLLADPLSLLRPGFLRPSRRALRAGLLGAVAAVLTLGGTTPTASAVNPPNVSKFFVNPGFPNGMARLAITITNPGANGVSLTGISITDNFPPGMVVASPLVMSNNLGGTFAVAAGGTSLSLTGAGPLLPGDQGTIFVVVQSTGSGVITNTTGNVSSTEGGTGSTASGMLIATGTTITSSSSGASPSGYALPGANVTLKMTVTTSGGTFPPAAGSVQIVDTTTSTVLGNAVADSPATSGSDTRNYVFTVPAAQLTATGTHNLTASYNYGLNSNVTNSTSAVFPLRVGENPSLIVTTTSDSSTSTDGQTSLREALAYAATLSGAQTITFSNSTANGAVNFADGTARTITLVNGELAITSSVTLSGPGAKVLTLDAHQASRVLNIGTGASVVSLSGLTFANGFTNSSGADGAGIRYQGSGPLTLSRCAITGCFARGAIGGGLATDAARNGVTLLDCSLSGNSCTLEGGAISTGTPVLTLINTTLSRNSAQSGDGGISTTKATSATLINCTVAGNPDGGFTGAALTLKNTIFLDSIFLYSGTLNDGGGNLLTGTPMQAGLEVDGNGDPVMKDNGGPTQTIALVAGSPAIDAGVDVTTLNGVVADTVTTTIVVADATAFPTGAGFTLQIDSEQLLVTAKTGNMLTVTRGANGTTAATHSKGAAVNPAFDQRGVGFARVRQGNPASAAAIVDIGAFEVQPPPPPTFATGVAENGITLDASDATLDLTGATIGATPPGGTFSGTGVKDGVFHGETLDPGTYTIIYTITDSFGNPASAIFTITITATNPYLRVIATSAPDGSGIDVAGEPAGTKFTKLGIPSVDAGAVGALVRIKPAGGVEVPAIYSDTPPITIRRQAIRAPVLAGIIVRAGDAAPAAAGGGATLGAFVSFKEPVFGGGAVAFGATIAGAGVTRANDTGLWGTFGGGVELIAGEGQTAPGSNGAVFDQIQSYVLTDDGAPCTFLATLRGTGVKATNRTGLWQATATGTSLIFRTGDLYSLQSGSSAIRGLKLFVPAKTIPGQRRSYADGSNRVAAFATFAGGRQGLIVSTDFSGNNFTNLVLENTNVGHPGLPSINRSGFFAMRAGLTIGAPYTNRTGRVTAKTDHTILAGYNRFGVGILAQEGTPVSSTDPELFTAFEEPAVNNDFNTAFFATVKAPASQRQVLVYNRYVPANFDYESAILARSGTAAAGLKGGELWQSFTAMVLPDSAYGPVFLAKLSGPGVKAANNLGLWATNADGIVLPLVRTGDTLSINGAAKTVSLITTLGAVTDSPGQGRYVDQDGDVSALLTFTDHSTALVYFGMPAPTK